MAGSERKRLAAAAVAAPLVAGCSAARGPAHYPAPRGAGQSRPTVDALISQIMVLS